MGEEEKEMGGGEERQIKRERLGMDGEKDKESEEKCRKARRY